MQQTSWITVNGEAHPRTPSQVALVDTPRFKLALRLYRIAHQNGSSTAEQQRERLTQWMQDAYTHDLSNEAAHRRP